MKRPALAPIVRKWQRRLRLQDWRIEALWATEEELAAFFAEDGDETEDGARKVAKLALAGTDFGTADQWDTSSLEHRRGRLLVKKGSFANRRELESAIVHELLHALLWPIAPQTKDARGQIFLEQVILTIEEALVPPDGKDAPG